MKVSVIIPAFNRYDLLKNCIDSLLNQSINQDEYEVIVVDNNSSDRTRFIVVDFYSNITNIKLVIEKRKGLVYTRHTGVVNASNEILIFADDDAEYNYNCIEEILKVYSINDKAVAVGGKIDIKWDKEPENWIYEYEKQLGKLDYGSEVIFSNKMYINGGLFSIKKSKLIELVGFNPDQIGNYLVGDGETGLCKKIHKKGYIIGWTPFAVMQHIQFVDKNGTKKDIERRFYNNGICQSYGLFRLYDFKVNKLLIKNFLNILKKTIKLQLKSKIKSNELDTKFKFSNLNGQLYFYFLFLNKKFRNDIKKENWF